MKKLLLICCITMLCSCSLFKKRIKTTAKVDSTATQVSTRIINEVDTSKNFYRERFKITIPVNSLNDLPKYVKPYFPDMGTTDLKAATKDLQQKIADLKKGNKDQVGADSLTNKQREVIEVELERLWNLENYKYKNEAKKDSANLNVKKSETSIVKEPINTYLVVGIVLIIVIAIFIFFKK